MGTGDIVAQTVVERHPRKVNLYRTLPYAVVGLGVVSQ